MRTKLRTDNDFLLPMQPQGIGITTLIIFLASISISLADDRQQLVHLLVQGTFSEAVVLAQTSDLIELEAEANQLRQQGLEHYQKGQLEAALQAWQKALKIYQQLSERQREAETLGNLGIVHRELGNYGESIDYFNLALDIQRDINNHHSEAKVLENLGNTYQFLGYYNKAIEYYEQALKIAQEIGDHEGEGSILANLGVTYTDLGNYEKAITHYRQSLSIAREISNYQIEGAVLHNLGLVYQTREEGNLAIDHYQRSLSIARRISDQRLERSALGSLGLANSKLGDYPKAIDYYEQSLAIARKMGDPRQIAMALNNLGRNRLKAGELGQAEQNLREAIEIWDSLRQNLDDAFQVSLVDTLLTYILLQRVLVADNQLEAALESSEHGRARAFVDLLSKRLFSNSEALYSSEPPTIEQIQQIARAQNATLVEYSIIPADDQLHHGKSRGLAAELYIWVVQPTGEVAFRQVDLKSLNAPLEDLVADSRESIGVSGRGSFVFEAVDNLDQRQRLQQLHQLLIQPIADLLPKDPNDRVIFIPQGSLFLTPFPALRDETGKYLIEKHTILTAPAIQALELTRLQQNRLEEQNLASLPALIVGNPTMPQIAPVLGEPSEPLSPLPGAEREAMEIAQLLETKAVTGKQATKADIVRQMPSARIIHFATHGLLDNFKGQGVPGAIALAPSGNGEFNDGLLTSGEILEMELNAELAVLSACDTGRGDITGDGVIGLSRSLFIAGVPSVIVSLWSVPDAPTASLMTEFYRNLEQGSDKAQALRQAMLATMKHHPNPRDWAAFTLIGEAE